MAFNMGFSKEEISGPPPVPAGQYDAQLKGFKPKESKDKDSVNLNAEFEIIGNDDLKNRKFFATLSMKAPWIIVDFVHACGLVMEEVQDEYASTEKANYTIPGIFEGSDGSEPDPAKWKYQGPLTNKTLKVELAEKEYQGKKSNEVRQFICAVPDCKEKHSTNLIK
jgi:hypothetical protein